jgi:hypothetical protein
MSQPSPAAPTARALDHVPTRRAWPARPLPALLAYLLLFALLCLPWLATATRAIPINTPFVRGDTRLLTWILWWVATSLTGDPSGVYDAPINHPAPEQLTGSEHFAGLQVLFLPVWAATGNPFLAMNAILFLGYPLAAFAMCRLLLALGFAPGVAWVSGLAFALGANQVPAQVHHLHVLALWLPATALALHRLRDAPTVRSALLFGAIFLLACFTAYYTVAVLLPVVGLWSAAELLRRRPGRARFLGLAGASAAACLAALAAASLPYLTRAAGGVPPDRLDAAVRLGTTLLAAYLHAAPAVIFGGTSLVLGVLGCVGLLDARLRGITLLALALVATGVFLVQGLALDAVAALPPSSLTELLRIPLRFVRMVIRYAAIAGFGLALLGAVALQLATRRLPRLAAAALLAVVALVVTVERGRHLWQQDTETSAAWTTDAAAYDRVAQIAAEEGRGPLLELPLFMSGYSLQPEAMMGAMRHRLPLVSGHTGYLPPHRPLVDAAARRLPDPAALQELVDMTGVRWILLRPASSWASPKARERFLRALSAVEDVGPTWSIDGWTLLAVRRAPVRPELFAAIARGALPAAPDAAPAPGPRATGPTPRAARRPELGEAAAGTRRRVPPRRPRPGRAAPAGAASARARRRSCASPRRPSCADRPRSCAGRRSSRPA